MSGTAIVYPAGLPGPAVATVQPAERRALSDAPGPRSSRVRQRDFLATQQIQFPPFDRVQMGLFRAWWHNAIYEGGAWFAAAWPLPAGMVVGVRKFLAEPTRTYLGGGYWQLSGACEVRGRGELPFDLVDPFFDSVILLLHGDGLDGSSAIVDSSRYGRATSGQANVLITDDGTHTGSGSIAANGNAVLEYAASSIWTPQPEFTLEFTLTVNNNAGDQFLLGRDSGTYFLADTNGTATYNVQNVSWFTTPLSISGLTIGETYRLAWARDAAGVLRTFRDGVLNNFLAGSSSAANSATFGVLNIPGRLDVPTLIGRIEELRYTQGVCRYTASYEVAEGPFPDR